jgi:hypothetical protein
LRITIVRLYTLKVVPNEFAATEAASLHGVVNLGDGGFLHFEGSRLLGKQRDGGEEQAESRSDHQIIV